jgi:hypothetical protein
VAIRTGELRDDQYANDKAAYHERLAEQVHKIMRKNGKADQLNDDFRDVRVLACLAFISHGCSRAFVC